MLLLVADSPFLLAVVCWKKFLAGGARFAADHVLSLPRLLRLSTHTVQVRSLVNEANGEGDGRHNGYRTDMFAFGRTVAELFGGKVSLRGVAGKTPDNTGEFLVATEASEVTRWGRRRPFRFFVVAGHDGSGAMCQSGFHGNVASVGFQGGGRLSGI